MLRAPAAPRARLATPSAAAAARFSLVLSSSSQLIRVWARQRSPQCRGACVYRPTKLSGGGRRSRLSRVRCSAGALVAFTTGVRGRACVCTSGVRILRIGSLPPSPPSPARWGVVGAAAERLGGKGGQTTNRSADAREAAP